MITTTVFRAISVLGVCLAFLTPMASAGTPVVARFQDPRPIIVAHRGCWRITAENSLSGLKACAERGIDIVEIDIRLTKDRELVLMHDETLDRMTNLSGRVEDHSLAEFKTARLRLADGGKDSPITTEAPPTFVDELRAAKGNTILYLDIKVPSAANQIYEVIEHEGAQDWVVFPADTAGLGKMPAWVRHRALLSAIQCGVDQVTSGCFTTLVQAIDAYRSLHPLAIGVFFRSDDFLKGGASAAAAFGTRLHAWSNAPSYNAGRDEATPSPRPGKVWDDFLGLGLSVIGTDDAVRLSEYLKSLSLQPLQR